MIIPIRVHDGVARAYAPDFCASCGKAMPEISMGFGEPAYHSAYREKTKDVEFVYCDASCSLKHHSEKKNENNNNANESKKRSRKKLS